jgi:hypothetical protein
MRTSAERRRRNSRHQQERPRNPSEQSHHRFPRNEIRSPSVASMNGSRADYDRFTAADCRLGRPTNECHGCSSDGRAFPTTFASRRRVRGKRRGKRSAKL